MNVNTTLSLVSMNVNRYAGLMKVIQQCCGPVLTEPIAADEAEELAAGFKLLADPVRLRILSLIANSGGGELCGCDLPAQIGRSQPTVSHHLSLLAEAGLVTREQRGKWAWFKVEPERVAVLRAALDF